MFTALQTRDTYLDPREAAAAALDLEYWNADPSYPWEFDLDAIEQAKKHLNLSWSLSLARVPSGPSLGSYECPQRCEYRTHYINISEGQPWDVASCALWHELTHAQQAENYGGSARAMFSDPALQRALRAFWSSLSIEDYLAVPIEPPALLNMRLHFDLFPLCRQAALTSTAPAPNIAS